MSLASRTRRGVARSLRRGLDWLRTEDRRRILRVLLDSLPAKYAERELALRLTSGKDAARRWIEALSLEEALEIRQDLARDVLLDYEPREIRLQISARGELRRTNELRKEPWTVRWIESWVAPGHVLYDVGANVGAFSLLAALTGGDATRVYAFEPAFMNFSSLCRNVILNRCADRIVPLPIALGRETRMVSFEYADLSEGSALHNLGDAIDYRGEPFRSRFSQQVPAWSIDDLRAAFSLPAPNHMKIDVDGAELDVLLGAAKTLDDPRMISVLLELCPLRTPEDHASQLLRGRGFRLVERHDKTDPRTGQPHVSYLIYVREE